MSDLPPKHYFSRRDLREVFGCSNYRVNALIEDGILDEPIQAVGRHDSWTRRQVLAAIRRREEKENPKPQILDRPRRSKPLGKRHRQQIRLAHTR